MAINIILILACLAVLYYLYNGAIFVPTDQKSVATIVRLLNIRPGMKVADLGSGDGRIVEALARAGAWAVGFENNPLLFAWSWVRIKQTKLPNAKIRLASFWGQDLSEFDAVVVFGMTHIMQRLETKLEPELRPGTLVVSNVFVFPNWQPIGQEDGVKLYRLPRHDF